MADDLPPTVVVKPRPGLAATEPGGAGASPAVPERVGRFAIRDKLGEGGMGVVLLGFDPKLERKVAIKLLHPSLASAPASGGIDRLLREAHAMARLEHDNVITVHEVGEHDGWVFVAMEFIEGGTLTQWNSRARRTVAEVVDMHVRAGRGLAAAHAAGLVHRDFKPDNVLVADDGRVRVTDFGLVRSVDDPDTLRTSMAGLLPSPSPLGLDLTRTGTIMGTPVFMAPEQHRGERVGPEADQFAFCVSLYWMLANAPPFSGTTYAELAHNVLSGRVERLERHRDVPKVLADAIHRGLSVEPGDRFASMDELLAAITRAIDEPRAQPERRRRNPLVGAAVVAIVAVGAALGGAWWSSGDRGALLAAPVPAGESGLYLERVALPPAPPDDEITEPPAGQRPWADGVSEGDQKEALRLFAAGNKEVATSRFSEAERTYREALGHWDHPVIHYNLALVYLALDKPLPLEDELLAALRFGAGPLDGRRLATARNYLTLTRKRIARIELSCELPKAVVSLRGAQVVTCPGTWEGRVQAGVVQDLVVRRADGAVWSQGFQVVGGGREAIKIRGDFTSGPRAEATARAKEAYTRGQRAYDLGRFEEAIAGFEEAYEIQPDPALLFNIGQVHVQLDHCEKALFYFRRALASKESERIRDRIAEIEAICKTADPDAAIINLP